MSDPDPAWVYEPFGNPVDVDLSAEGAKWEHYLSTALAERVPHGSFAGSSKLMEVPGRRSLQYIEYEARESGLRSRLWVTVEDRWVFIAGDGPEDEAQVVPWVDAVLAATARMGRSIRCFAGSPSLVRLQVTTIPEWASRSLGPSDRWSCALEESGTSSMFGSRHRR